MSNSQKGFAPIATFMAIIIVVGLVGGFFYYQYPLKLTYNPDSVQENLETAELDETSTVEQKIVTEVNTSSPKINTTNIAVPADWKTYTNREYTVKYSPIWEIDEANFGGCGTAFWLISKPAISAWVTICGIEGATLIHIEKDLGYSCNSSDSELICTRPTYKTSLSINGNKAFQYGSDEKVGDNFRLTTVIMKANSSGDDFPVFAIDYYAVSKSEYIKHLQNIQTMLSSFSLTK